jgi:hypothetical protein
MARIRTIKPEFFTSSDITKLTPLARLFYVSLWCESDREGWLKWDAETLKMRYLPADKVDIEELSAELCNRGLIVIYSDEDREYVFIPSFKDHQVINNRESESILLARVKDASPRVKAEGKEGREGKGKERKGREIYVGQEHPDAVDVVFAYWQKVMGHTGAKLDAKRAKAIKARLTDGYLPEQLCQAVDGCKLSPHHQGQNESRTVYDDIELICRDGAKVDGFIKRANAEPANGRTSNQQQTIDALNRYLEANNEN